MKKYVFESLKFFCAAILCTILSAFATPSWGALPDGYTELQYIESTGTQYIDTGYKLSSADEVKVRTKFIDFPDAPSSSYVFGIYGDNANFGVNNNATNSYAVWGSSSTQFTPNMVSGTIYDIDMKLGLLTINGIAASYTPSGTFTNTTKNAYLFWANGTSQPKQPVAIYSFQIINNGTIIQNLVPAKNASGVIGMYDTVGNRFYTNAGTGEFIAGPDACDGTMVNYTSATGTGTQNGTPTPTNPIEPTFYKQGNMILRAVGNYKDSYDATTGKITRRVGVKVLNGTESNWASDNVNSAGYIRFLVGISGKAKSMALLSSAFSVKPNGVVQASETSALISGYNDNSNIYLTIPASLLTGDFSTSQGRVAAFRQWLADQYNAGTPVTIYYPLETETTEDWPASYCETPIKIATTKYNESAFGPLNTALANAISVVDSVVSNTITQAGRIATLQTQKQTRPNDIADDNEKCPAGKKCLLVEDASGVPHWYEIVENAWDLPVGYTQLEYIQSTGTQYIDTGVNNTGSIGFETDMRVDKYGERERGVFGTSGGHTHYVLQIHNSAAVNGGMALYSGDGSIFLVFAEPSVTGFHKYAYNVNNDDKAYRDDTVLGTIEHTQTAIDYPFYLFARDVDGSLKRESGSSVTIKYFKIYRDGTLVRDFIPAKNSSGVVGMFDTVSGTFFTNAGTGEFIAGDPVAE